MPGSPRPGRRRTRRSRSQTAALRAHAEQLGLDVPDEWVFEDDGHSGATPGPPGAGAAARPGLPGPGRRACWCYSPDRLARKYAYQALLIEEFAKAGTRVMFVKGPRGDSPEDAAAGAVPGHDRRVRDGPRSSNAPAAARPTAPRAARSTCSPAPRSATATSARASTPRPATRSWRTRPRSSPSCSPATPTAGSRSLT